MSVRRVVTDPIIKRLIEIQHEKGMTSTSFAELLGLDKSTWSKVRSGDIQSAGRKILDGALRAFPELAYLHVQMLQQRNNNGATRSAGDGDAR